MSLWSDKPTFIAPSWEILSGTITNMCSINDVLLQVTRAGYFIIYVKPNIVQD